MPQHVIHFPATDPATASCARAPTPLTKTGARERRGRRWKGGGGKKKKKLRKVGLEVELKRDKMINQTCVCVVVFFFFFCKKNKFFIRPSGEALLYPTV